MTTVTCRKQLLTLSMFDHKCKVSIKVQTNYNKSHTNTGLETKIQLFPLPSPTAHVYTTLDHQPQTINSALQPSSLLKLEVAIPVEIV